jgi:hypothetical protein
MPKPHESKNLKNCHLSSFHMFCQPAVPLINLKFESKMREKQANRFHSEAVKAKRQAQLELKRGNRLFAKYQAEQAYRLETQAILTFQQAGAITGWKLNTEAQQNIAELAKLMNDTRRQMIAVSKRVDMNQLAMNRHRLDGLRERTVSAHLLLTSGEDDIVVQEGADALLNSLEQEIEFEQLNYCPQIPHGFPGDNSSGDWPNPY